MHTQRTKQCFLVPLEMSQEFPSCVTGAAEYALDSGKGLILQIIRHNCRAQVIAYCSKASAAGAVCDHDLRKPCRTCT